ncbi:hypothetical protein Pst134EA_027821 [Puccinia striiformis f. sp. tritici]|uniref:hypothetical protein n=1 Tax=Puccinia striiformis f. sp. tritici TaxID=168172 RepID=UPI002007F972|nr:hypothetical protein Pst134EA_027821 [Puccinia striiformis f. sp. tritici]KAH9448510.1 hypothetical protein Pst134EA_027821 [Puccinia striiformis f. sp. tritici]KAI9608072.1 hypothetical protein H4Q26_005526 [Puccinia striiformis f. sp. tritici PST-130]
MCKNNPLINPVHVGRPRSDSVEIHERLTSEELKSIMKKKTTQRTPFRRKQVTFNKCVNLPRRTGSENGSRDLEITTEDKNSISDRSTERYRLALSLTILILFICQVYMPHSFYSISVLLLSNILVYF